MAKKNPEDLLNCTCLNLRMAARRITQLYDQAFRPIGLRGTQFTLLSTVADSGPTSITHLADTLVMDRTTLTRDLRPLARDGLIEINPGEDRRVRLVSLTRSGRTKVTQGIPIWEGLQAGVVGRMGKKKWRRLMKGLKRVSAATE